MRFGRAVTLAALGLPFAIACSGTSDTAAPVAEAGTDAAYEAGDAGQLDSRPADALVDEASAPDPAAALPPLPLHTSSRWILDANGKRFKLASVNWYGAEEKDYVVAGLDLATASSIAKQIRAMGFNSVRLPWSNEMLELDPVIADSRVAKNPTLRGKHAMEVMDQVIAAIAHEGLVVILVNHTSRADWCCTDTDGNGLWYQTAYPEASWLADWRTIVTRYLSVPAVVGADLRNELRPAGGTSPAWGGADPALDWHAAAERGGNAVLGVNANLLVMVEGIAYSGDFTGAFALPVQLAVPNRLVYAPHDYSFFHPGLASAAALSTTLGDKWGYLLTQGQPYTAPVWVGEFGTCHTNATCLDAPSGGGLWYAAFHDYLTNADIDWAYWALNGTEATGSTRTLGAEETYGVLDPTWTAPALAAHLTSLQVLMAATQGP